MFVTGGRGFAGRSRTQSSSEARMSERSEELDEDVVGGDVDRDGEPLTGFCRDNDLQEIRHANYGMADLVDRLRERFGWDEELVDVMSDEQLELLAFTVYEDRR
ncbi:MAG: hypothetical protein DWQ35_20165 [Planctomycetota bacterium]|nr:MAG: hypothetical protein DWQ35_20165 [Planctomycetota bacterium]REK22941.1 MAG: hypothetical protein DWQ42_16075 [Planctomycetota bacterium]REK44744.1 MAG: hypothetical protein DWQ46_08490 [Planctomycetota bacterium]